MGPEGLEPSPNRLRAGRSAARTSVPIGVASRPGRSRTSTARLSAGCSSVNYRPSVLASPLAGAGGAEPLVTRLRDERSPVEPGAMGPEGFEPPPTGLKGRHAAATPRPRPGHQLPGFWFDPGHRISPHYNSSQVIRAAGFEPAVSCSRSLRISQPLPRPGHSCEQPVWESNPPLRLERAVSLADRRTGQLPGVGRGALESPSAGL